MYCYVVKWPVFSLQRGSAKSPIAPSNFSSLCLLERGRREVCKVWLLHYCRTWHHNNKSTNNDGILRPEEHKKCNSCVKTIMPTVRFICFNQKNFSTKLIKSAIQGVPHLRGFHYPGSHHNGFWLMYAQVGDFCVSRESPTLPLMQILRIVFFFKYQNRHKVGTLFCCHAMPCLDNLCLCLWT